MGTSTNLSNQLLIAMPSLRDPNFERTVSLICVHSDDGAFGIILNRPTVLTLGEVFEQLSLTHQSAQPEHEQHVLHGGPVSQERGFVIHTGANEWESTWRVSDNIGVTTSRDILTAMADGNGPHQALIALGYACWGAGQLEAELADNAWLSAPVGEELLFDLPYEDRWEAAARRLGVDLLTLSPEAGHA